MSHHTNPNRLLILHRSAITVGVLAATLSTIVLAIDGETDLVRDFMVAYVTTLAMGLVVWVGASTRPGNRLLGILTLCVFVIGFYPVALMAKLRLEPDVPLILDFETQVPADLPSAIAWIEGVVAAIGTFAIFMLLTFGFLLFPDGRLPSRRWRWVASVLAVGLVAAGVINLIIWNPSSTVAPAAHPLFHLTTPFLLIGPVISIGGLIVKYRRSDASGRDRIRWIFWGGIVAVPTMIAGMITGASLLIDVGLLTIVAGYGMAIVRHRLFDVNLVISRTLVFGALVGFIGLIYIMVVAGVGSLVGSGDEPNPVLAIAATALVATAFQPARRHLERFANRLVYGRRATPYQVLADFSRRVAATSETLLGDAARSLVEGTRAEGVVITTAIGSESVESAAWPPAKSESEQVDLDILAFPILENESTLGTLEVHVAPGESLAVEERRLAEQLVAGMGLALTNRTLTERLTVRVDELRRSRRRLVAMQDEARRRLERDLHDGAQQQLVALKVKLGLCQSLARGSGSEEFMADLARLAASADRAVEALRDFARGIYPALLETEGLEAALGAQLRRSAVAVTIETADVGRYDREIESTVYFCVIEVLRGASKSTDTVGLQTAQVDLAQRNGSLTFRVTATDNGDGASSTPATPGLIGLTRVTDRLDAVSGTIDVKLDPEKGTTVVGSVPATPRSTS